ncbi:class I SAM-dependent methyltransferase [Spirosoma utsteinense]|uniref:Ubiquinone/menaquinone biosynthesis C-methylase UbiE n=1 Tax=Spirosoma utsteinense TaxID=2585773 RepID=A0ABR6WFB8_9BACT|nr:class I SAM-dependent methyltransferase [Spirosoma utsteinense]MBC3789257.1 ubiquinone/menaquinone biosynthesis C-methylase UbiE [Spirosoma utsteinense]MBC3794959.1 ubiquinone/menaquinone biosynthesis C-methylase UbiE [Spirosoma utsteinense]
MEQHWNHVYHTKQPTDVSWYEEYPHYSVSLIEGFNLAKTARVIDVGGGDSRLVDALLELGYLNLTVLDISEQAIKRAKARLGSRADQVQWIVSDVTRFAPSQSFDAWHDRATFHFLTTEPQVDAYLSIAEQAIPAGGFLSVATFSDQGPTKCSGLTVRQYSSDALTDQFAYRFTRLHCEEMTHPTPFGTQQLFTACQFQRKAA